MSQLVLRRKHLRQPQYNTQIDTGNPAFARPHAFISAFANLNLASGVPLLAGTGAANGLTFMKGPKSEGLAYTFRKNYYTASEVLPALGTQSYVEFWYGYPSADQGNAGTGASDPTFLSGSSSANSAICSRMSSYVPAAPESWGVLYRWNDVFFAANDILTPGALTVLVVIRKQDRMEMWRDGVLRQTVMIGPWVLGETRFINGAFVNDPYWCSSSDMLAAGRFLGEWTPAQVRSFSENPWIALKAPQRVLRTTSSGPTYTLPLDAGAFVSSGQQAALKAARKLTAAAGSFTMTGVAAALRANRRLQAVAGTFAVAEQGAALKASRRMTAAPGALSFSANGAALKAARRLPAAAGAVALTGAPAKLIAARKLAAAPGAFALTGGTATFVYTSAPGGQGPTYTLTGGSGAFLLTASAARLLLARRLVAAAGAFSAAGSPIALVVKRRLAAAAGSLAIVAAPAGLRATRRLLAAAASFSLTGSTATFFYSPIDRPGAPTYTLTAVGGALGLTGTGIGMRARRRLSGGAGQLTLTGSTAQLVYSQQIVYARAPAGTGYAPQRVETRTRPVNAPTARPAATQRNNR